MNKRIHTYEDLLKEKQQLEVLLQAQKELIRYDLQELKAELAPVRNAFSVLGKMFTRDRSNPLLTGGANSLINLLVRKVLLARAGWITKLAVPFLIKNVSSHFVAEKKDKLLGKIFSLFSRKHHNGKAAPGEE